MVTVLEDGLADNYLERTPLKSLQTITQMSRQLCITLFHLILHTRPPPLDSCFFPFASTNTVRSTRKPKQLILPRVRTSRYVKSFFFRSALLWNTLPANLQNITCHRKFKKNIEAHWSAHKYSTKFCLLP